MFRYLKSIVAICVVFYTKAMAQSPQTIGAVNITTTSAQLLGYVITSGSTVYFEYGLSSDSGVYSTMHVHVSSSGTHQAWIFNLKPKTQYRFRIVEYPDYYSPSAGQFMTFTTASLPPTAATLLASYIGSDGATLNGSVNPNGTKTYGYFEYGTTTSYGSSTPQVNLYSGTNAVSIFQTIGGFSSGTVCHYRAVGVNSNLQDSYGRDVTFTCAVPPIAVTMTASYVKNNEATLHGTVNAMGTPTYAIFEYGKTIAYGATATNGAEFSGSNTIAREVALTGLDANTIYHYRMVGRNRIFQYGYGNDMTFTTACTNKPMLSIATTNTEINNFGFNINWGSGRIIVVDTCTNLFNPIWVPLQTNTLLGNSLEYIEEYRTNSKERFYRIRSP